MPATPTMPATKFRPHLTISDHIGAYSQRQFVAGMARSYAGKGLVPQMSQPLVPTQGAWSTLCRQ